MSGLSADQVTHVSGESSDRVQRFKRWFWSVVEKMNNIERQDLVSTVSKAPLPSASSLFRSWVATWTVFVVFMDVFYDVCVCRCYSACQCVLPVAGCILCV